MASEEEMAEMQRLSANFSPEIKGPLIGQRTTSESIVKEYAQADPTYVTKTEALQKTYPYYRTVMGDGNCGWRALPFGLFERLIALNSVERMVEETSRLEAFNNYLEQSGVDKSIYADFVDPTFVLLNELAALLANGEVAEAEKHLWQQFNEAEVGNAVIMHFRLIASAQLKIYADNYSPFLVDAPDIPTYCAQHIDPFAAEIEQMGLQALSDAVFEPASIAFEVLYLDRSEGAEVTRHEGGKGSDGTVRLLYRPGHYDLLYKPEDVPGFVGEPGKSEGTSEGVVRSSDDAVKADEAVKPAAAITPEIAVTSEEAVKPGDAIGSEDVLESESVSKGGEVVKGEEVAKGEDVLKSEEVAKPDEAATTESGFEAEDAANSEKAVPSKDVDESNKP